MLNERRAPLAPIVAIPGDYAFTSLINNVRTIALLIRVRCQVTIAGGPITAIRNRGSILAACQEVGLNENGTNTFLLDGPSAGYIANGVMSPRVRNPVRLTSLANGVYDLEEEFQLPITFQTLSVNPSETAYLERDVRQKLQAFVKWNPVASVLADVGGGGATLTFGVPTITVRQVLDDERGRIAPYFLPWVRQITQPIAAAVSQDPIYIRSTRWLRGLLIKTESNAGEQSDILNSLVMRWDNGIDILGPNFIPAADLLADTGYEFGGDTDVPGYLMLWFQKSGRLSNILNPAQGTNLRLEVDAQPSVTGTGSLVRLTLLELYRETGLTTPSLPFDV